MVPCVWRSDVVSSFLLDTTRNTSQVHRLDSILEAQGEKIDRVLLLVADNDELVVYLLNRQQSRSLPMTTRGHSSPLKVYEEETIPLIAIYRERGIVKEVNGLGLNC